MEQEQKTLMAKRAAVTMFATMSGLPGEVQLEATLLLARALLMANVKPDKRVRLFKDVAKKLTTEFQALEKKAP